MEIISQDELLWHQGSLLSFDGNIVASYDLEQIEYISEKYTSLSSYKHIKNASVESFKINYQDFSTIHIINGMGVTLGDSIIGLTAIKAIQEINKHLSFEIYRPALSPMYVNEIYYLTKDIFSKVRTLPHKLNEIPDNELKIDVGNHLFWPQFSSMPMIDFFLWALGVEPELVPSKYKSNGWLKQLSLPTLPQGWANRDYVLFCHQASTPLRSIPPTMHQSIIDWLWDEFGLPILGFSNIKHPHYMNVKAFSKDTAHFLSWIKNAHFVLTPDSAAVHIAAGFDIPTTAIFTSISPELRVRDYPNCHPIMIEVPSLSNMQASARQQDLILLESAYRSINLYSNRSYT